MKDERKLKRFQTQLILCLLPNSTFSFPIFFLFFNIAFGCATSSCGGSFDFCMRPLPPHTQVPDSYHANTIPCLQKFATFGGLGQSSWRQRRKKKFLRFVILLFASLKKLSEAVKWNEMFEKSLYLVFSNKSNNCSTFPCGNKEEEKYPEKLLTDFCSCSIHSWELCVLK